MATKFRGLFKKKPAAVEGHKFEDLYTISSTVLGSGAYAEVRLGQRNSTGEQVAIKIIDKTDLKEGDMAKLHKEVNILKSLKNPNVVRVYDAFDLPEQFYIVMEYVNGGELFAKIVSDSSHFSEAESREIIRTVALALKHCKDRGVIHRDVKPENILMTEDGKIKLADFNLSKQIDQAELNYSILQTMCGTPNYVAPEVISGKPYSYKCDIWSLGVISFLLLSGGYLPFFINPKKEGRDDLLRKVKQGQWKFNPERAWKNVSEMAKDFMTKVLCRDPEKRLGYEQLLAHPWFKAAKGEEMMAEINIDALKQFHKLRMMVAGKVFEAVSILENIMNDTEELTLEEKAKDSYSAIFGDSFDN